MLLWFSARRWVRRYLVYCSTMAPAGRQFYPQRLFTFCAPRFFYVESILAGTNWPPRRPVLPDRECAVKLLATVPFCCRLRPFEVQQHHRIKSISTHSAVAIDQPVKLSRNSTTVAFRAKRQRCIARTRLRARIGKQLFTGIAAPQFRDLCHGAENQASDPDVP